MEDILFHMLVVVPLTRWITNADRPWNRKSTRNGAFIALAVLFVIGIMQSTRSSLNHFEIIGVPPGAPAKVVASTYRKLSLQYHPDKNPSMEAKEIFASIRESHEVLSNDKRRDSYLRFGDFSTEGAVSDDQLFDVLLLAFLHFTLSFLFGYMFTYGHASVPARQLYGVYLCICFASELLLRTGTEDGSRVFHFVPYVGSLLPFERVVLLRAWGPLTLNALLLIGDEFAEEDQNEFQEEFCRHLLKSAVENIKALGDCLLLMEKAMLRTGRLPLEVRWGDADGPRLLQFTPLATPNAPAPAGPAPPTALSRLDWSDSTFFDEMERRAREKAQVAAAMENLGFRVREGVDPKQIESERRRLLQESGFTERVDVQTPWALEALPAASPELRDVWMETLKKEMANWPKGLVVENLLSREECQSYAWKTQRKKFQEVLEQSTENERGGGFSLGTFLFFFMLFIRWYTS